MPLIPLFVYIPSTVGIRWFFHTYDIYNHMYMICIYIYTCMYLQIYIYIFVHSHVYPHNCSLNGDMAQVDHPPWHAGKTRGGTSSTSSCSSCSAAGT